MKTSKLLTLALSLVFLSSTVFAGKTSTDKKDTTSNLTSTEMVQWDYTTDPLQEVLEMEPIPTIILPIAKTNERTETPEQDFTDLLEEVLEMEAIPAIEQDLVFRGNYTSRFTFQEDFENAEEALTNPLEEVLNMEDIPTINQPSNREYILAQRL